jgi:hypothetical protein
MALYFAIAKYDAAATTSGKTGGSGGNLLFFCIGRLDQLAHIPSELSGSPGRLSLPASELTLQIHARVWDSCAADLRSGAREHGTW